MKLMDEKGRLFKKFNIIDAVVILLLVIILAALGWKTVTGVITAREERRSQAVVSYEDAPHLCYQVVCTDVPKEVADAFVAQMELPMEDRQLMIAAGPVEGYLVDCTAAPGRTELLRTVYFSIEAALVEKDGIYSVGSQEIRIGKSHIVKTYQIEISGSVYSMEVAEHG